MNTLKRFPHFKQHDTSDCGPTSLYWNRNFRFSPVSNDRKIVDC